MNSSSVENDCTTAVSEVGKRIKRLHLTDSIIVSPAAMSTTSFPDNVLSKILLPYSSTQQHRNSVSLLSKHWYEVERLSRTHLFIGNCYSVSPEIVTSRFPNLKSVTIKGKPRFSDFNLVPMNWGAEITPWLAEFKKKYEDLEELRCKRMCVSDQGLQFIAKSFPKFKALSLVSCEGFSSDGIAEIASHCKNLTELDIQDNDIDERDGSWLSHFPESCTSLEVLNFANMQSEVDFDALEKLVSRCKSLKVLKVNKKVTLEQLQRLLVLTPQLTELGAGSFSQDLTVEQYTELTDIFQRFPNLHTLSGFWGILPVNVPALYLLCSNLIFLNLCHAALQSEDLAGLLPYCTNLRRLWVLDTVEDRGLEAVSASCHLLEELRVLPADPFGPNTASKDHGVVTEEGFVAVSRGCPNLRYVLYFCRQMTNVAVATIVQNCPGITHFRLCIMAPCQPDYVTNEPMDEAFGAVVKTCPNLERLAISGLLTDLAFEYIGKYAKNLEVLSVAFVGSSDYGMKCVMEGCTKLRKFEIRDCPFGDEALLSGLPRYESMRSLWMSACAVTINACRVLAEKMPRLNVEVIKEDEHDDTWAEKVYVYRTVAGPRRDAPPFVITL
ncbi:hypothetical protein ACHQM5_004514 [Ranunculus cassubicifolius]